MHSKVALSPGSYWLHTQCINSKCSIIIESWSSCPFRCAVCDVYNTCRCFPHRRVSQNGTLFCLPCGTFIQASERLAFAWMDLALVHISEFCFPKIDYTSSEIGLSRCSKTRSQSGQDRNLFLEFRSNYFENLDRQCLYFSGEHILSLFSELS